MCIRDRGNGVRRRTVVARQVEIGLLLDALLATGSQPVQQAVSYTHLRAHETVLELVCRLLLEKKKNKRKEDKEIA